MPAPSAAMTEVYAARRAALFERLPESCAVVLASVPEARRNNDVSHEYRQHSDVHYLTGFTEPETLVLLVKDGETRRFELVVRPRDPERETWDGRRAGVEGATRDYKADAAHATADRRKALVEAIGNKRVLVFALGEDEAMDREIIGVLNDLRARGRRGPTPPAELHHPAATLHELRLFKRPEEAEAMQRAADVSAEAHARAMKAVRPGMTERQLQGVIEGTFRTLGSERNGYQSIVASGANATILHYHENDAVIGEQDLVLIDAGAEVDYYTADITRTFPASGRFTPAQRELYDLVLKAQLASIEQCRPGVTHEQVHDASVRVLTEGMVRLGLLSGDVDALVKDGKFKRYYMHGTAHWLGMDVHDVGAYRVAGESRPLEPGFVLTVEPGLYVAEDDQEAPERFRGLGVRIEDDVLVTEGAPRVLTAACPKDPEEIEALMAQARQES